MRRLVLGSIVAAALAAGACHHQGDAVLVLVVTASGSPTVTELEVTIMGPAGASSKTYARPNDDTIAFPTTLSAEIPPSATGALQIAVSAIDSNGTTVASGTTGATVGAGDRPTIYVALSCSGNACAVDGGSPPPADGGTGTTPRCGNGRVDPGETCDTAIAPGDPGACPPADCDDGIPCTTDTKVTDTGGCTIVCKHTPIQPNQASLTMSDGCCPSGTTRATDIDCSPTCGDGTVQAGETCDTAIPVGQPGACPTPSECTVPDPCALTLLLSVGTCQALCVHYQIMQQRTETDGCCPPGGTNAVDPDCPAACGDGIRQANEQCDVGITPPLPGSCPTKCDGTSPDGGVDGGSACTLNFITGTACQAICVNAPIKSPVSGDGCCLSGTTHAMDTDCPATCGDGEVEPGETCDKAATGGGACPTGCPPSPSACLQTALTGSAADCSAACVSTPIATCSPVSDGCCPAGCTAASDPDCSATCGDGVVQANETCDTAIAAGHAGACPTACDDGDPCTKDLLLSAGTCGATCVHLAITAFVAGDGCCPPGGNFAEDADCPALCGDGVVERPIETCDSAVPGSCPTDCSPVPACTTVTRQGSPGTCTSACVATPITACVGGDGCCPPGCTGATDPDCGPICGDGALEAGEACDRAITAGLPGACPRTCNDGDACTTDIATGSTVNCSRKCTHVPIVGCLSGDGCCPPGCTHDSDSDCAPTCGDGKVGAGETCDPPNTCPTTCPDDGDPCTVEQLTGDPAQCNVVCRHVPITTCSGTTRDSCCPTGCSSATDSDC
jgi:hypothetical protein